MRIYLAVSGIIFILFAIVQLNDTNPFVWICLYLIAALTNLLALKGRLKTWTPALLGLTYLAGFIFMFQWRTDWIHIEESREGAGLLLCAINTLVVFIYLQKKK